MNSIPAGSKFGSVQAWARIGFLAAMALLAVGLRAFDPATLSWLPIRSSCGAVTGLPCIFCGTTRAFHQLLNGNFAQALYFNWLAFPVAALAVVFFSKWTAELIIGREFRILPVFRVTPRTVLIGAMLVVVLWTFQVSIALAFHKHELLNPNGLLYALLVR